MTCIRWPREITERIITRDERKQFKMIEKEVSDLCGSSERDSEPFRITALVMAGATLAGPSVRRLLDLSRYAPKLVDSVFYNMRACGLWSEDWICADWLNDDLTYNIPALCCHLMVAEGKLTAIFNHDRGWLFKAVQTQ